MADPTNETGGQVNRKKTNMIVIICDATKEIGYGHLKRCLVLAASYRKLGFAVNFLMRGASPAVETLLKTHDAGLVVISTHNDCLAYLLEQKEDIRLVIIDHYEINADLEKEISNLSPVLVIDDLCRSHWCDLLVDQTHGRTPRYYGKKLYKPTAEALLGSPYTIIDPVYKDVKTSGDRKNILLTFGATDPQGVVLKVLDILKETMWGEEVIFHVPLSSMSPCLDGVKQRQENTGTDIRLYLDLPDLCSLYKRCGIAVGAPGTSLLERIYCGLINIIMIVSSNQRDVGQNIAQQGAAIHLGEIQTLDPARLVKAMSQVSDPSGYGACVLKKAVGMVDGKGPVRIVKRTIPLISDCELRPVTKADMDVLYKWQHEKGARDYFRNTEPPTKEEHQRWFDNVLSNGDVTLYIIEWCTMAVGYIRLNPLGKKTEVSVLISSDFRNLGLAKRALLNLIKRKELFYCAYIRPENRASIGLFTAAGFQYTGQGEYIYNAAL